jgi:hypothetical protein
VDPYQVGDPDLLNTDFGSGSWSGATPGGYGYGVDYGGNTFLATVAPQAQGQAAATGGDQSADFDRYLSYGERIVGLINPFTAQYQNEQGIRLTQEQVALQNARNAGQYVPPKQDMTIVYVIAGVAAIGLLVFVFKDKG